MDTNELIIFSVTGIVIPIVYAKLIKSSTDTYTMIIISSILGGIYSYINSGDISGAGFPFLAMIISLIAFLVPSWSVAKTFEKTLTVMIGLIIIAFIGRAFMN